MFNRKVIALLSYRKGIILSLCLVIPTGFGFKWYKGPCAWWFNDYGAGVFYEIFWCLVIFLIQPKRASCTKIAAGVFAVTCILEVLQLWHPAFLQTIRDTFLGTALIGSTFVWWDFPHYALGCFLGCLWMRAISRSKNRKEQVSS